MTNQEAYNKICEHLMAQGAKSVSSGGVCMYRGPDGMKCAIGCLIPDKEYWPEFEGKTITDMMLSGILPPSLKDLDFDMLDTLQRIHDMAQPDYWPQYLREYGERNGYTVPDCIK